MHFSVGKKPSRYNDRPLSVSFGGRRRSQGRPRTSDSAGRVLTLLGQMSGENQPETRVALHRRCRGDVNVQRLTVHGRVPAKRVPATCATIARWRGRARFVVGGGRETAKTLHGWTHVRRAPGDVPKPSEESTGEMKVRERDLDGRVVGDRDGFFIRRLFFFYFERRIRFIPFRRHYRTLAHACTTRARGRHTGFRNSNAGTAPRNSRRTVSNTARRTPWAGGSRPAGRPVVYGCTGDGLVALETKRHARSRFRPSHLRCPVKRS